MTAPVPSRLPRSTTRGEQLTDSGSDGGREVEAVAAAIVARRWETDGMNAEVNETALVQDIADALRAARAARAAAAPTSGQLIKAWEEGHTAGWDDCAQVTDGDADAQTANPYRLAALLAEQPGGGK